MRALRRQIHRFAPYNIPLLVEGEESTGKRLVAEVIHNLSPYRDGPFIAVDCAALSEMMLAIELFGCEPGFCTQFSQGLPGKVEFAMGGTLLLEHIEVMPKWVQGRLLRLLEDQAVERLGSSASAAVYLRTIASTVDGCDQGEPGEGGCRDLLDRLCSGFSLKVPPLRDRGDDVVLLSHHFLAQLNKALGKQGKSFSPAALTVLETYSWPGNLRELGAVIRSAVLIADRIIAPQHLPLYLRAWQFRYMQTAGRRRGSAKEM